MPTIDTTVDPSMQRQLVRSVPQQQNNLVSRLTAIRTTVTMWRSQENIRNSAGDVHNLVAKFPVYLAQYADGDWNCNNYFINGELAAGCLPNLVNEIADWSHKDLVAGSLKPISVDSPELVSSPPPFIFFTGHKDFHLTEGEVDNLRKYLQAGGAIWGGQCLRGRGFTLRRGLSPRDEAGAARSRPHFRGPADGPPHFLPRAGSRLRRYRPG